MYCEYFGFSDQPFGEISGPDGFVFTETHRRTFEDIKKALCNGEAGLVLTGDAGVGKTSLLQVLSQDDELNAQFTPVLVTVPERAEGAPLAWCLSALGLDDTEAPVPVIGAEFRRLQLEGRPALLLVDDAHSISEADDEALAQLLDFGMGGESPYRIVLAGSSTVADQLNAPDGEAAPLHLGDHIVLHPMTVDDAFDYVEERIRRVGGNPGEIFDYLTVLSINDRAMGTARLVNMLCDICLTAACQADRRSIDVTFAETAMARWLDHGFTDGEDIFTPAGTAAEEAPEPELIEGQAVEISARDDRADETHAAAFGMSDEAFDSALDRFGRESEPAAAITPERPPLRAPERSRPAPKRRGIGRALLISGAGLGTAAAMASGVAFLAFRTDGQLSLPPIFGVAEQTVASAPATPAADIANAERQLAQLRERIARADAEVAYAESRAIRVTSELKAARSARDTALVERSAADKDLAQLRMQIGEAQARLEEAEAQQAAALRQLAEARAEMDAARAETGAMQAELETTRAELDALRGQIARAEGAPPASGNQATGPRLSFARQGETARIDTDVSQATLLALLGSEAFDGPTATIAPSAPDAPDPEPAVAAADPVELALPPTAESLAPAPADTDLAEGFFRSALERTEPEAMAVQYARAAAAGHGRAAYFLAQMYETGDGVAFAPETAKEWYAVAANEVDAAAALLSGMDGLPPSGAPFAEPRLAVADAGALDLVWDGLGDFVVELAAEPREAVAYHETARTAVRLAVSPEIRWWRVTPKGMVPGPWMEIGS